MSTHPITAIGQDSPFSLANSEAYAHWRNLKLKAYPADSGDLIVDVVDPYRLTKSEHAALLKRFQTYNMAVYGCQTDIPGGKDVPRSLGAQFGLSRLDPNILADDDGITSLQMVAGKSLRGYIPYTNRRILWHTDGYYNTPDRQIRSMILHCVSPAVAGGDNGLMDHEIAYILLRDKDPAYIEALMADDVMTIPANTEASEQRAEQTGPVFSIDPQTGTLHMRYTARTRSILWKQDDVTVAALEALEKILADDQSCYGFQHRLQSGQGLLCNNILHSRSAFGDSAEQGRERLLYRARYYDRIADTGPTN